MNDYLKSNWFLLGIIIILLGVIIFCLIPRIDTTDNYVGLVLAFIGVLATFIVVGNYVQIQDVKKEFERRTYKIELLEKEIEKISRKSFQPILLEIEKLKEQYYESESKDEKVKIIGGFRKYNVIDDAEFREHLFAAIQQIAEYDSSKSIAINNSTFFLLQEFLTESNESGLYRQIIEFSSNIIYDVFVKQQKLYLSEYPFLTIKFAYKHGLGKKIPFVKETVFDTYKELERTLTERKDASFIDALNFTQIFKNDLTTPGLAIPIYPDEITKRIENEKKNSAG